MEINSKERNLLQQLLAICSLPFSCGNQQLIVQICLAAEGTRMTLFLSSSPSAPPINNYVCKTRQIKKNKL